MLLNRQQLQETGVTLGTGVTKGVKVSRVTTGSRRQRSVLLGVLALVLATALGTAWAGPEDRLEDAEERLEDAERELSHSTERLADATAAYEKATAKLPAAEEQLRSANDQLASAEDALSAAQAAVETARDEADLAKRRLAEAKEKVVDQLDEIDQVSGEIDGKQGAISRVAVSAYQRGAGGELAMTVAALKADTLSDFAFAMKAKESVVESEAMVLSQLRGDRATLANERVVLEDLRDEAERREEEAQQKLDEMKAREAEAREAEAEAAAAAQAAAAAKAEVESLVQARETAVSDAEAAKKADAAEYEKWKSERESIQDEIDRIERERREKQRAAANESDGSSDSGNNRGSGDGASRQSSGSGGESGGLAYPVANPYVTSPYGMRLHPVTGVYKLHDGTDFRAYCGTPIRAAVAGRVEWAYYRGGYGNQVAVSGGKYVTTYSHLSRFAVSSGQRVSRGEIIGYSGTTGYSTACHLHFMVYINGNLQNPMSLL